MHTPDEAFDGDIAAGDGCKCSPAACTESSDDAGAAACLGLLAIAGRGESPSAGLRLIPAAMVHAPE